MLWVTGIMEWWNIGFGGTKSNFIQIALIGN
jgi:hypothetical protein